MRRLWFQVDPSLSSLFLVTYLIHHAQVGSAPFQHEGWIRRVYFAVLVPHVALAVVIVPLALFTIYRGWTGRLAEHRTAGFFFGER